MDARPPSLKLRKTRKRVPPFPWARFLQAPFRSAPFFQAKEPSLVGITAFAKRLLLFPSSQHINEIKNKEHECDGYDNVTDL